MNIPFFAFYPQDWLADPKVRSLSFELKGVYLELMCNMWTFSSTGECSLPDDDEFLARMLGIPEAKWSEYRAALIDSVAPVIQKVDGRITNPRLRVEWLKAMNKSSKAKKSADARWGAESDANAELSDTDVNANALRTHCEGNASAACERNAKQKQIQIKTTGSPPSVPNGTLAASAATAPPESQVAKNGKTLTVQQEMFGALVRDLGYGPDGEGERQKWNRAIKTMTGADKTARDIPFLIERFKERCGGTLCTPLALANNLGMLLAPDDATVNTVAIAKPGNGRGPPSRFVDRSTNGIGDNYAEMSKARQEAIGDRHEQAKRASNHVRGAAPTGRQDAPAHHAGGASLQRLSADIPRDVSGSTDLPRVRAREPTADRGGGAGQAG